MRQKAINRGGRVHVLFSQLAAEKKKAITASFLIALMAFMWIRVLTKEGPEAAEGASTADELNIEGGSGQGMKISFVELPKVDGRNDAITRDFFASNGWRHFGSGQGQNLAVIEEVNIISKDGNEEVIKKVAKKLKLEAIVLSTNPRAFINNKVMSIGDKVLILEGIDTYECEIVTIEENTVVMKCREAEITLRITQMSKIDS